MQGPLTQSPQGQFKITISLGLLLFFVLIAGPVFAATYCVDDVGVGAADGGCAATCDGSNDCTLVDALAVVGSGDTITFKAALGQIDPTATFTIPAGVTLDGGSNHDTRIDGTGTGGIDCLTIGGNDVVIKGLVLTNCKYGITNTGSYTGSIIQGNYIGVSTDGSTVVANSFGINVSSAATGMLIGTDGDGSGDTAERNIISGNSNYGIYTSSSSDGKIKGNYIGLDSAGTAAKANAGGIQLAGTAAWTIGTDGDGTGDSSEGNVIAGNASLGVYVSSTGAHVIAGNTIGLDTGGTARSNDYGIFVNATGTSYRIGTNGDGISDTLERNIISGNTSAGIYAAASSQGKIKGNYIGLDSAGTTAKANGYGVQLASTAAWTVGTDGDGVGDASESNVIAGNTSRGITISTTGGHVIAGNIIGLDTGGTARSNAYGIYISSTGTSYRIGTDGNGTSDTLERNIISGNATSGIYTASSSQGKIKGNYIGLDSAGTTAKANGYGVDLSGTGAWIVGTDGNGTGDASEGNYIAGNTTYGIYITSTGAHVIAGNTIGLDTGGTAMSNAFGVYISSTGTSYRIGTDGNGTSDTLERNIISGNATRGIYTGSSSQGKIKGNYIGLDSAGTTTKANGYGIQLGGSGAWTVGTDGDGTGDAGEMNYISGNTIYGIYITSTGAHVMAGNIVGLDTGGTARPNDIGMVASGTGISYRIGTNGDGTSDTLERNIISGNTNYGIYTSSSSQGKIKGNYIGLDSAGTTAKANGYGIYLNSTGAWIVGTDGDGSGDFTEKNVISGNTTYQIYVATSSNVIAGNYIGPGSDGTTDLGIGDGIYITTGSNNRIGTNGDGISDTDERNVVSGFNSTGSYGIRITLCTGTVVAGNYIGLTAAGTASLPSAYGVFITGVSAATIGTNGDGTGDSSERNYISGNSSYGVYSNSGNVQIIAGNVIGLDTAGTVRANGTGVVMNSAGGTYTLGTNSDGTSDSLEGNVISGNTTYGISTGSTAGGTMRGNMIGTDSTGLTAKANGSGINLAGTGAWTIGTNGDGVRDSDEINVISGNTNYGVYISASSTTTNTIAGNKIGAGSDGTTDLGNGTHGVYVNNIDNVVIGGDVLAEENTIRFNGDAGSEYGVYITGASASNNTILRNKIYDNQTDWYVANNATATPTLARNGTTLTITQAAGQSVYVFKDTDADGTCEPIVYLGSTDDAAVTDNADGTYSYTISGAISGEKLTATAFESSSYNTSQLANCIAARKTRRIW